MAKKSAPSAKLRRETCWYSLNTAFRLHFFSQRFSGASTIESTEPRFPSKISFCLLVPDTSAKFICEWDNTVVD